MKRRWTYLAIVVGVAAASHVAAIWAVPRVIMEQALRAGVKRTGGENRVYHFGLPTADKHEVVLPSPDVLYAACVYDVRRGPVSITADVPESYWSVSLYASDTDNFFVLNDREVPTRRARVVLFAPGAAPPPAPDGEVHVTAESSRGLVLFRTLVRDPELLDALKQQQRTEQCAPL